MNPTKHESVHSHSFLLALETSSAGTSSGDGSLKRVAVRNRRAFSSDVASAESSKDSRQLLGICQQLHRQLLEQQSEWILCLPQWNAEIQAHLIALIPWFHVPGSTPDIDPRPDQQYRGSVNSKLLSAAMNTLGKRGLSSKSGSSGQDLFGMLLQAHIIRPESFSSSNPNSNPTTPVDGSMKKLGLDSPDIKKSGGGFSSRLIRSLSQKELLPASITSSQSVSFNSELTNTDVKIMRRVHSSNQLFTADQRKRSNQTAVYTTSENQYQTSHGRLLKIVENEDNIKEIVVTEKNFPIERGCTVLAEEKIMCPYTGRTFTVWHIDRPIEGLLFEISVTEKLKMEIQECMQWTDLESLLGLHLGGTEMCRIAEYCSDFMADIATITDSEAIKLKFKILLEKAIEASETLIRSPGLTELSHLLGLTYEYFYRLTENHIMNIVYDSLLERLNLICAMEDGKIAQLYSDLKYLDPIHLGLATEFGVNVLRASSVFQKIQLPRNVIEKAQILTECVKILSETVRPLDGVTSPEKKMLVTTDQVIPLLLLLIIRSQVPNIFSILGLMLNFCHYFDIFAREIGYSVSSLEAAVTYLINSHQELVLPAQRAATFWKAIGDDSEDDLKNTLARKFEWPTPSLTSISNINEDNSMLSSSPGQKLISPGSPQAIRTFTPKSPASVSPEYCRDLSGNTCLLLSVSLNRSNLIRFFLRMMNDEISKCGGITTANYKYETALHLAVRHSNMEILELLLNFNESSQKYLLEAVDVDGNTALHLACQSSHLSIIRYLHEKVPHIWTVRNNVQETPIFILLKATFNDDFLEDILFELCKQDPSLLSHQNINGECILHVINSSRFYEKVLEVIHDYSWFSIRESAGRSPFMCHCISNRHEIIKCLLTYFKKWDTISAQTAMRDDMGRTSLHLIAMKGHTELLDVIGESFYESLYALDFEGNTPLHLAIRHGHQDFAISLYRLMEFTMTRNLGWMTGVDLARRNPNLELAITEECLKNCRSSFDRHAVAHVFQDPDEAKLSPSFLVQSLVLDSEPTMFTVERSLSDFSWLRRQLLLQYPEVAITNFDMDMDLSAFRGNRIIPGILLHHQRRLDAFLQELLDHPVLGADPTLLLFLQELSLDKTLLTRETSQRAAQRFNSVSSADETLSLSLMENMESDHRFFREMRSFFVRMENCYAALSNLTQVLSHLQKDSSNLVEIMSSLGYSMTALFHGIPDAMLGSPPIALKAAQSTQFLLTDCFHGISSQLNVTHNTLRLYENARLEYLNSHRTITRLQEQVDRQERQVANQSSTDDNNVSDDLIMRLSETYYELSRAKDQYRNKYHQLHHMTHELKREMDHQHQRRHLQLRQTLHAWARLTAQQDVHLLSVYRQLLHLVLQ